jgi:Spy/CpxP family protein refolding chaperone
MSRKKLLIAGAIVVVLLAGAGVGVAEYVRHNPMLAMLGKVLTPAQLTTLKDFRKAHRQEMMKRRGEHGDEMEAAHAKLSLSDDQEDKLLNLVSDNETKIVSGVEPLLADEQAIREAVSAPVADPEKFKSLGATLGKDLGDVGVLAAGLIKQGRAMLTPEQNAALDTIQKIHAEGAKQRISEIPARSDELVGLWKDLNLSSDQLLAISDLAGPAGDLMQTRGRVHAEKREARMREVLTGDQMDIIKAYQDEAGPAMHERMHERMLEAAALIKKLNLSQDQLDQLTKLIADRQPVLQPALTKMADAGFALRQAVLAPAPDEAAIRKAARAVGDAVAQALPLYADLIGAGRGMLKPEQTAAINDFVIVHEGRFHEFVLDFPTRFETRLQLRDDLNLTTEQREAMRQMRQERGHHHGDGPRP